MAEGMYRIGIVGALSLVGKELADELPESLLAASDVVLLDDDEEAAGQVATAGDEPALVQPVAEDSFARMDFVFFAGSGADTGRHWQAARRAGASLVDLSFGLEGKPGVEVRAALAGAAARGQLTLETAAVVSAHPAAVMLALVAGRLARVGEVTSLAATVIEPASQAGREAMDELHQQTVNLLSFQPLPRDQYDAQVAFNVLPGLGEAAKVDLRAVETRILRHYATVSGLPPLALQLVQAPVFHGYAASLLVEMAAPTTVLALEKALEGEDIDVVVEDSDPPSNLSASGQGDVMVRVRGTADPKRFWVWMAADNLKLAARNAIACANELKRLRPRGKVQ